MTPLFIKRKLDVVTAVATLIGLTLLLCQRCNQCNCLAHKKYSSSKIFSHSAQSVDITASMDTFCSAGRVKECALPSLSVTRRGEPEEQALCEAEKEGETLKMDKGGERGNIAARERGVPIIKDFGRERASR